MASSTGGKNIVVIGGGIIGASTAYFLSKHPKLAELGGKITLLEGTGIASASSGKSGGFLALDWHGPDTTSLAQLSYGLHSSLASEHSGSTAWGYRTLDTLSLSYDADSSSPSSSPFQSISKTKKAGSNFREPPPTWLGSGVSQVRRLGDKTSTAQVTPGELTYRLVEMAKESGRVEVLEGMEAVGIEFDNDSHNKTSGEESSSSSTPSPKSKITGVFARPSPKPDDPEPPLGDLSGATKFSASDVVICAGPWSGRLTERLFGKEMGRRVGVDGQRAHSIVIRTAKEKPLTAHALFTSLLIGGRNYDPELYCRPNGTVYICGSGFPSTHVPLPARASLVDHDPDATSSLYTLAKALSPTHFITNEDLEGTNASQNSKTNGVKEEVNGKHEGEETEKKTERVMTVTDGATLVREQACYLPVGRMGPVIGKLRDGVWVGAGHAVWGVTLGPGTGLCLAEMILDGKAKSADIETLAP